MGNEAIENSDGVGLDDELVVIGAEVIGDAAGMLIRTSRRTLPAAGTSG